MLRKLTNNECKQWINDYYRKYHEKIDDHEFMTKYCLVEEFFKREMFSSGPIWLLLEDKDIDKLIDCADDYCNFYDINVNSMIIHEIKFFYHMTITSGPLDKFKQLVDSKENIDKMFKINSDVFANDDWVRFLRVYWNIETGKNKDKPNLHTHALIIFDKSNKNFERDYKRRWEKTFGKGNINILIQKFGWKGNQKIYNDKYDYLHNIEKSILHQNFRDLGILETLEH